MLKKSTVVVPLLMAATLFTTSCSGGAEVSETSGESPAKLNDCIAETTASTEKAREDIPLVLPENTLDISSLKGKKVWIINVITNQFINDSNEGYEAAAAAAGVDLTLYDGQGTVNGWNEGVQQAIAQGADAIALFGIDSSIISESVKDAADAGIVVTEALAATYDAERHPGLFTTLSSDYYADGITLADWTLADSECTAETFLIYSSALPVFVAMRDGAMDRYAEICPDCQIADENVDLANVATDIPRVTQTHLTQSPNTGYVLSVWDAAVPFVDSAVAQINPDVKVTGRDGLKPSLEAIRDDGMQQMTVAAPPTQWIAWTVMDDLLRGLAGEEPSGIVIPTRVIDSTNIGDDSADVMPNYVGFEDEFRKVWGL